MALAMNLGSPFYGCPDSRGSQTGVYTRSPVFLEAPSLHSHTIFKSPPGRYQIRETVATAPNSPKCRSYLCISAFKIGTIDVLGALDCVASPLRRRATFQERRGLIHGSGLIEPFSGLLLRNLFQVTIIRMKNNDNDKNIIVIITVITVIIIVIIIVIKIIIVITIKKSNKDNNMVSDLWKLSLSSLTATQFGSSFWLAELISLAGWAFGPDASWMTLWLVLRLRFRAVEHFAQAGSLLGRGLGLDAKASCRAFSALALLFANVDFQQLRPLPGPQKNVKQWPKG